VTKFLAYYLILTFFSLLVIPAQAFPEEGISRENAVVLSVRKASPAVVNISSTQITRERLSPFSSFYGNSIFDEFFSDFFPGYQREYKQSSLGSGVIVDGTQGFILTNHHVIEGTSQIIVKLVDNREFEAQVVGSDPDSDLAVLKILADGNLPSIKMGDSDGIMIGETVLAIGNPFGLSHTVTTGVVSALHRSVKSQSQVYNDLVQTDASINPGNSGGPLLNINGELIGINTAIYAKAQGIGFAIPINKARRILDDLIRYGEVHSPWIGVEVRDTDAGGIIITEIESSGPASRAKLRVGDRIVSMAKRPVESRQDFEDILSDFTAGDKLDVTFYRNGQKRAATIWSEDFPQTLVSKWAYTKLGIRVQEISTSIRRQYGLLPANGVIISDLKPGSYVESIGLRVGDLITRMNDMDIKDVADFSKAIIRYRWSNAITLLVVRDNFGYYVTLRL
jgi:serine protease Do